MEISCIILGGGKSSRIGQDKIFLKLNNNYVINRIINTCKYFFEDTIVVVKNEEQKKELEKITREVKIVQDLNKTYSPLAGIKEGIKKIKNDYVFITACDMPFINKKTIKRLINRIQYRDCILYKSGKKIEPFCAIYNKKIFDGSKLSNSLYSIIEKVHKKLLLPITEQESFFNINTKENLVLAKKSPHLR